MPEDSISVKADALTVGRTDRRLKLPSLHGADTLTQQIGRELERWGNNLPFDAFATVSLGGALETDSFSAETSWVSSASASNVQWPVIYALLIAETDQPAGTICTLTLTSGFDVEGFVGGVPVATFPVNDAGVAAIVASIPMVQTNTTPELTLTFDGAAATGNLTTVLIAK